MKRETKKYISTPGPQYPDRSFTVGPPDAFRLASMTDGTTTVLQLILEGEVIATGVARRHPGDPRRQDLGVALAAARVFTEAASAYARTVDRLLEPEENPSGVFEKLLRSNNRATARREKDARRKAARELFRMRHGWDHTDYVRPS